MKDFAYYTQLVEEGLNEWNLPTQPANLYDPVNYILTLGGKRMRPLLSLMMCDLKGGDAKGAVSQALAVEIFHNFTLLHDDIMDRAPVRRGKPTVHKKWNEPIAILSGDVMMIQSYQLLSYRLNGDDLKSILDLFNTTAIEVCEGQQMDMDFEEIAEVKIEDYLEMIRLKTAVLPACALQIGAMRAGIKDAVELEQVYQFGETMGLAFQLQDDYLDSFGDPATFGKQVGGDIIENKKTFLQIRAMQLANKEELKALHNWLAISDNDAEKVEAVKALYKSTGAVEEILQEIEAYYNASIEQLESITGNTDLKQLLKGYLEKMKSRSV